MDEINSNLVWMCMCVPHSYGNWNHIAHAIVSATEKYYLTIGAFLLFQTHNGIVCYAVTWFSVLLIFIYGMNSIDFERANEIERDRLSVLASLHSFVHSLACFSQLFDCRFSLSSSLPLYLSADIYFLATCNQFKHNKFSIRSNVSLQLQ